MEPYVTTLSSPILVSGLRLRTRNSDESDEKTALISELWRQFFLQKIADNTPYRQASSPIYGIYTAYDGGVTGYFDVMAGVAVNQAAADADIIEIQTGTYRVFDTHGPMPEAIIEAWGKVWCFFEQHPEMKRRFATDFESYTTAESAQIYIGILP
ncbi:GyrI-like domain-containing protein [Yersinia ruckeri]|uniref:GyrI-like domain-containing protein n=1 Tax=Yersinia ruckeri TaxID=29486 RepID=UPI0020C07BF0|nr:GyrI-like domain-containing protein [Yersinia ruckeri]MCW6538440.1 GyrI-like domain-containing protein [Yersinia ruckeri]MCW6636593.1 GyrI-like domain-containing protein [Yersinia ruckeri]UZX63742.1 GyrI-like domain-containing protein [Yersinia ruckeri]UZY09994.1 GyrI-like domain-containing protein [Yersinia ruckeri]